MAVAGFELDVDEEKPKPEPYRGGTVMTAMDRDHVQNTRETARVAVRRPALGALAAAGATGPILFTVLVVVQGLLNPDYNHLALPISAFAAWPSGWIQNVNFLLLGVLMSAHAIGLHRGVRQGPGGAIGPALLVLSGGGLLLAGSFPWSRAGSGFIVPPGHLAGAVLAFLGAGIGLALMSRRMAGDPRWRSLATYALATGVAMIVLFLVTFALARAPDAPLGPWGGAIQRVTVLLWFVCTIVLALKLRRVGGD